MSRPLTADTLATAELAELLDQHSAPLYAFLRGLVADPEHARDLLQDVYCDAWRAIVRRAPPFGVQPANGEPTTGDRRSWLFRAAYCRAVSARCRARLLRWRSLDAAAATDRAGGSEPCVPLVVPSFDDQRGEVSPFARRSLASCPTMPLASC